MSLKSSQALTLTKTVRWKVWCNFLQAVKSSHHWKAQSQTRRAFCSDDNIQSLWDGEQTCLTSWGGAVGNCRLPAAWMKAYSEVPVLQLCNSLRSVPIGWLWISNWIPQIQPVLHAYGMKTAHEWALVAMATLASHIWEKVLTSDLWLLRYLYLAEPWLIPMWVIPVRIPSHVKPIIDRFENQTIEACMLQQWLKAKSLRWSLFKLLGGSVPKMRVPAGYTALAYGPKNALYSVSRCGGSANMRLSLGYCMCTVLCWKLPEDESGRQKVHRCCTGASSRKPLHWADCGWLNPAEPRPRRPRFNLCFLPVPATWTNDNSKLNHAPRGGHIEPATPHLPCFLAPFQSFLHLVNHFVLNLCVGRGHTVWESCGHITSKANNFFFVERVTVDDNEFLQIWLCDLVPWKQGNSVAVEGHNFSLISPMPRFENMSSWV